jgi:hypothetical protein
VLLYLIQLAGALGIDPIAAAQAKLKLNALKYPVDRARGTSAEVRRAVSAAARSIISTIAPKRFCGREVSLNGGR